MTKKQLHVAHLRQQDNYDRRVKPRVPHVRDHVWLHHPLVRVGEMNTLYRPWAAPFRIIKEISVTTFGIQLFFHHKQLMAHQDRLNPCTKVPDST